MRATSLLASFSRRNFGTRSLKSENSEVTYSNASKEMQNDERIFYNELESRHPCIKGTPESKMNFGDDSYVD